MEMQHPLTLWELNNLVADKLSAVMPDTYWVVAEVGEIKELRGHCYMELIQKGERTATPIARASAKCWKAQWSVVGKHFEDVTGRRMTRGMEVLLSVRADFHANYGFSWIVEDVDPNFTLGSMHRKRQEILQRLEEEGVLRLNKELPLSPFAKRIAVISSENAAGYGDFSNQLLNNEYGLGFSLTLFPARLQGENVEGSVINALNAVNARAEEFDCVVIIRGGGATSDLSGFDTLLLAENVANFPLPVITGIGHERDESVLDIVSHTRVKTPTAAAQFLIDNMKRVLFLLDDMARRMSEVVKERMLKEDLRLRGLASTLPLLAQGRLEKERLRFVRAEEKLGHSGLSVLKNNAAKLNVLEAKIKALDPTNVLRRGYSITRCGGKALRSANGLKKGDTIETLLFEGRIISEVK